MENLIVVTMKLQEEYNKVLKKEQQYKVVIGLMCKHWEVGLSQVTNHN